MAFTIPQPIKMFAGGSSLPNYPSLAFVDPREGKRYIPVEIDWDGNGSTYQLNVAGLTTQPFSQMVMLDVDNTQNGADVTFYFPDSTDTLVVPALEGGLFPIFTNALQMYVAAPAALSSDVTRFRILNYRQEPVANPGPQASSTAAALNITAAGTTALIASGIGGTLTGYNGFISLIGGGVLGSATVTIKDHASGNTIDQATILVPANGAVSTQIFGEVCSIRFSSGIDVVVTLGNAPSINVNVTARYRVP